MSKELSKIVPNADELVLLKRLAPVEESHENLVERFARVVWSRLVEPGDSTALKIIGLLGAKQALEALISQQYSISEFDRKDSANYLSKKDLKNAFERWTQRIDRAQSLKDMQRAVESNCKTLLPTDSLWPNQLADLELHMPLILWTRGEQALLNSGSLAIVGARASTAYGEYVTNEFAHSAVRLGCSIVSGAAYGIDAVAHRSALSANGATIAVLAGGVDRAYPAGHTELLRRVASEGVVCSEMVPGAAPTRWRFLQRNRLIAALSRATLVTEAGMRSGSLNTAGHASHLGRSLGAVPGPINSVASLGTHRLLKEYDATLVTDDDDLKDLLGIPNHNYHSNYELNGVREPSIFRRVKDAMPLHTPATTSYVAKSAGLTIKEAATILLELEIIGEVEAISKANQYDSEWKLKKRG